MFYAGEMKALSEAFTESAEMEINLCSEKSQKRGVETQESTATGLCARSLTSETSSAIMRALPALLASFTGLTWSLYGQVHERELSITENGD